MTETCSEPPCETRAKALTKSLREYVGDDLRSVLRYDDDGAELVYVREDVADDYSATEVEQVVRDVRLEAVEKPHQEGLYEHGSLDCTVRCFDDAVEVHFPHDETSGTAVALDHDVLTDEDTLLGKCTELVDR